MLKALTQPQAAALRGITSRRLRQLDTEDNPPPKTESGQYDPEEFGKWLVSSAVNTEYDYQEERARLTHHLADKTELESQTLRGNLIPSEEVTRAWGDMVTKFRSKILALPGKLSTKAMAATSLREVEDFARDEIYNALAELAETIGGEYSTDGGNGKASATANSKPVGRAKKSSKPRVKRGAGKVAKR